MPLVIEPVARNTRKVGVLKWRVEWMKVGPTGAISLCASAQLAHKGNANVLEIVKSYHDFRLALRRCWPDLSRQFLGFWSQVLPEYAVQEIRADELIEHLEYYDVVDFDFLVDGSPALPKVLYQSGPVDVLRALAGLTRMSHVMGTYSEETVRALGSYDLGNRPDELWIANVERLTRHHPEHLTDIGKRLFMEDIVSGIEIVLQQRATLNYVLDWVRRTRATFLDRLTDESDVEDKHTVMRQLLAEMAWSSDLFSETISVDRDSGSSFFRSVISRVAKLNEVDERIAQVSASVNGLLDISQAVFSERSAAASAKIEKSSRNMGIAAVIVAIAAAIIAFVQLWTAVSPASTSPSPGVHLSSTVSSSSLPGNSQPSVSHRSGSGSSSSPLARPRPTP